MIDVFMDDVRQGPDLEICTYERPQIITRTISDTIYLLKQGIVHDMSLDHDMGYGDSGYDLLCWMERSNTWPKGNIHVHSANPTGAARMQQVIDKWKESK